MSSLWPADATAAAPPPGRTPPDIPEPNLSLSRDAFVVHRLRHLAVPLSIEPEDIETWMLALAGAPQHDDLTFVVLKVK